MINPKLFIKACLSSRIALASALLLAGGFGLVAAFMIPPSHQTARAPDQPKALPQQEASEAKLIKVKEIPQSAPKVAAQDLVAFCSDHVSKHRSFVIFRNGTCVVVNEPTMDPIGDARESLLACNDPEARFVPELTREGNLMISFKEPVFHNFTAEDREKLQAELDLLTPALLTPKEKVSAGDHWVPPTHARFGLLARRRMLEDAADPKPVKVIRAKERVTAKN